MGHWETNGKSNEWYTPKFVFDALGCRFDLDAAAPLDRSFTHVPADKFITENSLEAKWEGFTWLNPPFGARNHEAKWLNKMNKHRDGIVLTPDRTSAPWWQKAALQCDLLLMVSGKIKFIKPDGSTGKSPGTGTTFFAYGLKGMQAILNAQTKGLGIVLEYRPIF